MNYILKIGKVLVYAEDGSEIILDNQMGDLFLEIRDESTSLKGISYDEHFRYISNTAHFEKIKFNITGQCEKIISR